MHKVEIRLTSEGEDAATTFEVYTEGLKDNTYVETAPMQSVAGGAIPIVMFLEVNERVIVVAKGNSYQIVYDKEQNANVRVESEDEKKARAEREERMAQRQKDDAVVAAGSHLAETESLALKSTDEAQAAVKRAEREAKAEESKPVVTPPPASNPPAPKPASANTGPVDSKQVKT